MYLEITTTHRPATDLGYLLHKNPGRAHEHVLPFGTAHMIYTEATDERCTFALVLDVDPIALIRGKPGAEAGKGAAATGPLEQYVNDRPYAASSFLSVAIAQGLRTALGGRCKDRPELAGTAIPLLALVTPLPARGGGGTKLVRDLFEPLGYEVTIEPIPLDPAWPQWGNSPYVTLRLDGCVRLADLLSHLYVLIPVLDLKKHYFLGADEIDKLLDKGGTWVPNHPLREVIARRYMHRKRSLATAAIERLVALSDDTAVDAVGGAAMVDGIAGDQNGGADAAAGSAFDPVITGSTGSPRPVDEDGITEAPKAAAETKLEAPLGLHERRLSAVFDIIAASGARRILDLGCGSGKLLKRLMAGRQFTEIVGVDIGYRDLEIAARRLRLDQLPEAQRARIKLLQGALTYHDARLVGYDAAALVEVIEHVEPERLAHVERVIFEKARPQLVVMTTPNRDYNVKFTTLPAGKFRHADHRFEWTRAEFAAWTSSVAARFGYGLRIEPLGDEDPDLGAPSQMAVFDRGATP
ncbi:MAG: 3' terminal RNA ribose 2'-O-methyltransferase Hen1 [Hyphomicrobium aestuarii]|nr:3' terminal RNA ribose 2'-O-methyltransferase Hen1 [Hyphomicrobium aestuarii]